MSRCCLFWTVSFLNLVMAQAIAIFLLVISPCVKAAGLLRNPQEVPAVLSGSESVRRLQSPIFSHGRRQLLLLC